MSLQIVFWPAFEAFSFPIAGAAALCSKQTSLPRALGSNLISSNLLEIIRFCFMEWDCCSAGQSEKGL